MEYISMQVQSIRAMSGSKREAALAQGAAPVDMLIGTAYQDDGAVVENGVVVIAHGNEDGSLAISEGKMRTYVRMATGEETGYVVCCHPVQVNQNTQSFAALGNWTTQTRVMAQKLDQSTGAVLGWCQVDELVEGEYTRIYFEAR